MKASGMSFLLFTHGEALQLTTGDPDWATGLAGGTLTTYTDICVEGSPYHYTKDWDCGGNDLAAYGSPTVGSSGWIDQFKFCAAQCDAMSSCVGFNYPNPGNGNCWIKHSYQNIPSAGLNCGGSTSSWEYFTKTGAGTCTSGVSGSSSGASAVGDPHLQNVHGERFDLMKEGKHVLINIPRGTVADNTLLRVQADARRLGGQCSDMYFQEINVTGSWAEAKQAGGFRYSVSQRGANTPTWLEFGKVGLKVVNGRTDSGLLYLNVYVKHLGRAGFAVGGLLGEDDHADVIVPPAKCGSRMSLLEFAPQGERKAPSVPSIAVASLE